MTCSIVSSSALVSSASANVDPVKPTTEAATKAPTLAQGFFLKIKFHDLTLLRSVNKCNKLIKRGKRFETMQETKLKHIPNCLETHH